MQYQLIQLKKDGKQHELYYENDEDSFNIPLEKDDYVRIFQKIEPNFAFSTPDKLIQDHIKDGSITPTFKNGNLFNNEDMMGIMEKAKKEMHFITDLNCNDRDKKKRKVKNKTKKNKKVNQKNKKVKNSKPKKKKVQYTKRKKEKKGKKGKMKKTPKLKK
tara:strand:- start:37 stop:516 length:480 start_codon:yes stop_codon:yes gene_type:complete